MEELLHHCDGRINYRINCNCDGQTGVILRPRRLLSDKITVINAPVKKNKDIKIKTGVALR